MNKSIAAKQKRLLLAKHDRQSSKVTLTKTRNNENNKERNSKTIQIPIYPNIRYSEYQNNYMLTWLSTIDWHIYGKNSMNRTPSSHYNEIDINIIFSNNCSNYLHMNLSTLEETYTLMHIFKLVENMVSIFLHFLQYPQLSTKYTKDISSYTQ